MTKEEIEQLALLLVKWHNQLTPEAYSLYGHKMDKALARDTFTTLFISRNYEKLREIEKGFTK